MMVPAAVTEEQEKTEVAKNRKTTLARMQWLGWLKPVEKKWEISIEVDSTEYSANIQRE